MSDCQHYYNSFFEYIEQFISLPNEAKLQIQETFKPKNYPKDSFISKAGEVPIFHNFIVSGFVRLYYLDQNNNEITVDINEGSRFFTSYQSFLNQTVSTENLQCITECELLQINFEDFQHTLQVSETSRMFTIKLFEKLLAQSKQKQIDMANLSAETRYQNFARNNPKLMQQVPLGHIASFLGITQRHLSRLRKQ